MSRRPCTTVLLANPPNAAVNIVDQNVAERVYLNDGVRDEPRESPGTRDN